MTKQLYDEVFIKIIETDTSDDKATSIRAYNETIMLAQEQYDVNISNIGKDKYGRPYFINHDEIDMSISHTEGMIAVAVARGKRVGIDVEKIHRINKKIVDKYYSELEKKMIYDENEDYETNSTIIWTRKEAYSKYIGTGLTRALLKADMIKRSDVSFFEERQEQYIVSICIGVKGNTKTKWIKTCIVE